MGNSENQTVDNPQNPVMPYVTPENPFRAHQVHIVAIVLKIICIYVTVTIIPLEWSMLAAPFARYLRSDYLPAFLTMLSILMLIAMLWFFSRNIALLIVGRNVPNAPTPTPFDPSIFQPVAFSIMGVWIAFTNLSGVIVAFFRFYPETRIPGAKPDFSQVFFNTNTVLVVIGAVLFFSSNGLADLYQRMRNPNIHEPQNNPQPPSSTPQDPDSPAR
jgi:hypothetical protein